MANRPARWMWMMLLAAVAAGSVGCGYSPTPLYPQQYRTVAVPIFEDQSRTFHRGIEYDLSEAITKELELRTPYAVANAAVADTILQGSIRNVEQTLLTRSVRGGMPQEMQVTITVDFEWRDLSTGEVIRSRRNFQAVGRYAPTDPVGQSFEVGQHMAVEQLAREIVATLRDDL